MSCVSEPKFGPPIARLKWGTVYNYLPCIVKSYSINIEGREGWDNLTLYPRILKVSITLEEFRQTHGNMHSEQNEDLPGWDSILPLGDGPHAGGLDGGT